MSPDGGWSQMDLQGDVKLKEADRSGQADHASFDRAAQTATLTGHAIARDATTQTQAHRIVFHQNNGDIFADGGVRSTDFSAESQRRATRTRARQHHRRSTPGQLKNRPRALHRQSAPLARRFRTRSKFDRTPARLARPQRRRQRPRRLPASCRRSGARDPRRNRTSRHLSIRPRARSTPRKSSRKNRNSGTPPAKRSPTTTSKAAPALRKTSIVQSADQKMRGPVLDLYFTKVVPHPQAQSTKSQHHARSFRLPPNLPRRRHRRRHRRRRRPPRRRRSRRILRRLRQIRHERRKTHSLRRFRRHNHRHSIDLLFSG